LKAEPSKISDYAEGSKAHMRDMAAGDQQQPGDPKKGVEIIIDLVRNEGCAAGKAVPFRFPLGPDCHYVMKTKCEEILKVLDEWKPVIESTNYAGGPGSAAQPSAFGGK